MRATLYARASSNKQNEASCEDQLRECERAAQQRGCTVVERYADHANSGASMLGRSGIQELMRDARAGRFDIVFAESLDRSVVIRWILRPSVETLPARTSRSPTARSRRCISAGIGRWARWPSRT